MALKSLLFGSKKRKSRILKIESNLNLLLQNWRVKYYLKALEALEAYSLA